MDDLVHSRGFWSIVADSLSLRAELMPGLGGQSAELCRAWLLPGDAVASGRGQTDDLALCSLRD